jgi:hypothetical protein
MSNDHSCIISSTNGCDLKINIGGIDSDSQSAEHLFASFYAYDKSNLNPKFQSNCSLDELIKLYALLSQYSVIRDPSKKITGKIFEVTQNTQQCIDFLNKNDKTITLPVLESVINSSLSKSDIDTILGRKSALIKFHEMLSAGKQPSEPEWQKFFKDNDWIFGYGLLYKYLGILQKEAHVSDTDISGTNAVISDFIMSDCRFTIIVELKRPDTPLFGASKHRSGCWQLSTDLSDAISQILTQKADWEYKAKMQQQYTSDGHIISERTFDPDCLLIIGHSSQFSGNDSQHEMKKRTFELFRRNLRNIKILLYDEVYERAQALIKNNEDTEA